MTQALELYDGYDMAKTHCLFIVLGPRPRTSNASTRRRRHQHTTPFEFHILRLGPCLMESMRDEIPVQDGLRDHFDACVADAKSPEEGWCSTLAVLWFLNAEGRPIHLNLFRGGFEHQEFPVIPNWLDLLLE